MKSGKFVGCDSKGEGRNLHGMFRRSFEVSGDVREATLNLFADSVYELYVNGHYIEFGPARFDPRFPEFDVHDLKPHLREGRNVIAVLVKHFGCIVFRAMPARAGLFASGSIDLAAGTAISLNTPSGWKAMRSAAYKPSAVKQSFSLEPMEVFSQAKEPTGWREATFDDSSWADATVLDAQDSWGALSPRSIPFMSGEAVLPERVLRVSPLNCEEQIVSFSVPAHYWYEFNFDPAARKAFKAFLFYTAIYSPKAQSVSAGLFWGEHWLNGEWLDAGKPATGSDLRIDHELSLQKGWNLFFGKTDIYSDVVDFYLALPADAGLVVNADQSMGGDVHFRRTEVLRTEEYNALGGDDALPFDAETLARVSKDWKTVRSADAANNPARERDWDRFGADAPCGSVNELTGRIFTKKEFPDGFALELDIGAMRLLKPEIDIVGVAGATVDLSFSEFLSDDGRVQPVTGHQYLPAARAVCSRDRLQWSPMQPHGFRYLVLTVRNPKGDVKLNRLSFRSAEYPVEEIGEFSCSDPLLNDIWVLCKRTEMTDMEDAYIDCPGRERGMYIRDTIIQYHNNLALFGDHKLMRRCLKLYGKSNAPDGKFRACFPLEKDYTIPDFSLNMVEGFLDYLQQTGDLSIVRECWPNILENMKWFHGLSDEREDGLLDADWPTKRGFFSPYGGVHGDNQSNMRRDGVNAIFTAMYLSALQAAAEMAALLEDREVETDSLKRYAHVKSSMNQFCWDEAKGAYADTTDRENVSPQASIMAIRAGVPSIGKMKKLRAFMQTEVRSLFSNGRNPDDGVVVSPHFCFYLFDALYQLDLPELAENLMREGWSWMMSLDTKTCTEFFSLEGSWCHAWSASPAYYLSKNALGVQISDDPNSDDVEIRVQSALEWAEGTYPHPKGPIHIKWHTENGVRIFDRVEVPDGVNII